MHENSSVRVIYRSPQVARLVLNLDQLDQYRQEHHIETDDALAERIGVHPTQVSRVVRGGAQPGQKFIAGLLLIFGKEAFGDLFDVEPDAA